MGSFARRMVHNVSDVTDEATTTRAGRARLAAALASLLVHAALVWLLPPADLRPRRDPNVELAPVEIVEWTPPPKVVEPPRVEPVEPAPTIEPTPTPIDETEPPPTRRIRQDAEVKTGAPPTPTPAEPPAAPEPDGGGSDAAALPLTNLRGNGRPITSPRLSGRMARNIGGDQHGAEAPPVASSQSDAEPKTLAEAGFRPEKGELVYRDPLGHFKATLNTDGRVSFRDFGIERAPLVKDEKLRSRSRGFGGLSDFIRAGQGKEPWWVDKKKLLQRTEKLRLALAIKWAESQVEVRMKQLYRDLLEIWHDAARTAVQRRERLFQRWDECVEAMRVDIKGFGDSGKSELDELREKAGGEARASIEAFIRKHLPKGSEDAYPPEELRELNRKRHSEERFDPYAREG
jgi:hypothetical protein